MCLGGGEGREPGGGGGEGKEPGGGGGGADAIWNHNMHLCNLALFVCYSEL